LVREDFCDGFGDCMGHCPTGAIEIVEEEAKEFDEDAVKQHLMQTQGYDAVKKMEEAQKRHEATEHKPSSPCSHNHGAIGGGCPGKMMRDLSANKPQTTAPAADNSTSGPAQIIPSELAQWPVQLHLVNPASELFNNKEMVVLSTCSPIASPDVHWRYIKGRSVVVACPKLDKTEPYAEKLASLMQNTTIPKIIVVIMEVPCCKGLSMIVKKAKELSGRDDLIIEEHVMAINGSLKQINRI